MTSAAVAKSEIARKWWLWPLMPFAFLAGIVGFFAFFVMVGLVWPFAMIKMLRERKQIERKLVADRRLITWEDAILARDEEGKNLILEFGPNKLGAMWLMELSPETNATLLACPTYASWEADPRSALSSLMGIEVATLAPVGPYSQVAKRIEGRPVNLCELDKLTKESIRILPVYCEVSPTHFLYQWLRNTYDA